MAIAAVAVAFAAWPYFKYPGTWERAAAGHLDKVSVKGFEYVGEDASENDAVSRFWIRRGTVTDPAAAFTYAGRPLRRDHPGRDSLAHSKLEDELGWMHLAGGDMCGLTAFKVNKLLAGAEVELSIDDRRAVEGGTATLVRIVVTCGGG